MQHISLLLPPEVFSRKFLAVIFFLTIFAIQNNSAHAQMPVLDYSCELYYFGKDKRDALAVPDNTGSEFAFVLADNKKVIAQRIDKDLKLHEKLVFERPHGALRNMIGYFYSEATYNIVFANKKKKKFHIVSVDFDKNKVSNYEPGKLKRSQEEWLTNFAYKGGYYFLTINKHSSILNLYHTNQEGEIKKEVIDLADHLPSGSETLYQQIFQNPNNVHLDDVSFIVPEVYENIRATSVRTKIYLHKDQLIITNDKNTDYTSLMRINLDDLSVRHNLYYTKYHAYNYLDISTSSYFLNETLFQLKVTPEGMQILARDLKKDSIVKQFLVEKEEVIDFKNTPFIVSIEDRQFERHYTKTSKILRKIGRHEAGISVYKTPDKYYVTVGSYKPVPRGGGFLSGISGDVVMGTAFSINWTVNKDSYFEAVFDNELNHIKGRKYYTGIRHDYEHINIFDRILHFEDQLPEEPVVSTLFWFNDKYYYGYYSQKDLSYNLYEFMEYTPAYP